MKEKTQTLFLVVVLQIIFNFGKKLNFSKKYSTSSFSFASIALYHQILSIYSKAFKSETAPLTFGVQNSNLSGKPASV
ncbi:MAG: hypothetical protein LBU14_01940 [Candidatus Peribacteria bacterium]|nr:hypothetical protein [Candidatus Peribacteria bacterium]